MVMHINKQRKEEECRYIYGDGCVGEWVDVACATVAEKAIGQMLFACVSLPLVVWVLTISIRFLLLVF